MATRITWLLTSMLFAACGGSVGTAALDRTFAPEAEPAHPVGSLLSLVPIEARMIIVARPNELFSEPALRRIVSSLITDERLDVFETRFGFDPRGLTELVFLRTDDSQAVLARGPIDAEFIVALAGEQMAPVESSVDEPRLRRAGFIGNRRIEVAEIGDGCVMRVRGQPQLTATILAAADHADARRDRDAGPGAAAPFALYVPRPLGLPIDTPIGLLLAGQTSLVAWAEQLSEDRISLTVELTGEFPPGAAENFRAFLAAMADTDLGRELGGQDALPSLEVRVEEDRVRLSATVDADRFANGLRAVLVADMEELLGPAPGPPEPPQDTPKAGPMRCCML